MEKIEKLIQNIKDKKDLICIDIEFSEEEIIELEKYIKDLDKLLKMRIYYYLFLKYKKEEFENKSFCQLKEFMLENNKNEKESLKVRKESTKISLPIRINFGGGWSDTPPYCIENGGSVVNVSAKIDNILPIEVSIFKNEKRKIIFENIDFKEYIEINSIKEFINVTNKDLFCIPKGAMIICNIIDVNKSIEENIDFLGSGITISFKTNKIPKGSGLGISSILIEACIQGIADLFELKFDNNELYDKVLKVEQLISTGGGWQDQVGAYPLGLKLNSTPPEYPQNISVERIKISEKLKKELQTRFVLIYTGETRVAKNLLRKIMGRYIRRDKQVIDIINRLKDIAIEMKIELENGNLENFSKLLTENYNLSLKLDDEFVNFNAFNIFEKCKKMIAGKMICGAGKGGYAIIITKKGYAKSDIESKLKDMINNTSIYIPDCELIL